MPAVYCYIKSVHLYSFTVICQMHTLDDIMDQGHPLLDDSPILSQVIQCNTYFLVTD